MLHSFNRMLGFSLRASDGEIGQLHDLNFDDVSARIRYLVVDTGTWLRGRRVLLAPAAVGGVDGREGQILTGLSRRQIEESPDVDMARPVSRQRESELHEHYGWAPYWEGPPLAVGIAPYWGGAMPAVAPSPSSGGSVEREVAAAEKERGDPHLRSAREVRGYHIAARDGEIGHVEDFLVGDDDWAIQLLVVDTRNWLPGRKVVVSPSWLRAVDWPSERMVIDLTRDEIRSSPEHDPDKLPDRGYLERLAAHYGLTVP